MQNLLKIPFVFDMETQDPDDYITLLLLCGHPKVDLKAVTIMPGSTEQVGLVRKTLDEFDLNIPVGVNKLHTGPGRVSAWHANAYGKWKESSNAEPADRVLCQICNEDTVMLCGAPLKNLDLAMNSGFKVGKTVVQGGFAGNNVVPYEKQLEKFRGMKTCPSFNPNGCPSAALNIQSYEKCNKLFFVSKNVCHGVKYERKQHDFLAAHKNGRLHLEKIYAGMDYYLSRREGKAFHDPLAACCAINESIGTWVRGKLYREKGNWGTEPDETAKAQIIVDHNDDLFWETMVE